MTVPKEKEKPRIQTRQPGRLPSSGMFDRVKLTRDPHPIEEILRAGNAGEDTDTDTNQTGTTTLPSNTNQFIPTRETGTTREISTTDITAPTKSTGTTKRHSNTAQAGTTKQNSHTKLSLPECARAPISPERDFQKVPNSVTREAMAARLFRGKSKQVWDYLWSQSRGAVVPSRTVRRSRPQIKEGAGLGSMGTVDAAIDHLQAVGLIVVQTIVGEAGGNEYEVFTPEEVAAGLFGFSAATSTTNETGTTETTHNSVLPVALNSGNTNSTLTQIDSRLSDQSKTFSKTIGKTDDEDLSQFAEIIRNRARALLGRTVKGEGERWARLANVLMDLVERAAGRTEQVSSVPAFTTAVLLSLSAANERRARRTTPARDKQPSDEAPQPLSEELMQEQIAVLKELVDSGYPLEQIDHQFGRAFSPEEWQRIRAELQTDQNNDEVRNGDEQQIS